MRITFLGTGTSIGVPQLGCQCEVCTSHDPHDRRTRASALIEEGDTRILIDCGPDFRQQMLAQKYFKELDAILITHEHYDHVGGIDDLRPYSYLHDLPIYADAYTANHLRQRLPYCLVDNTYPGIPRLKLIEVEEGDKLRIGTLPVTVLRVIHGKLPILGFRIGDIAYLTDMTDVPPTSRPLLEGIRLLIIGALRHTPHATHQTVKQAIAFSKTLGNIPTYFIHMSHQVGLHAEQEPLLPEGFHFAYDGLVLHLD